jgi:glycosyltransferase involved in cell wall biosynthesis
MPEVIRDGVTGFLVDTVDEAARAVARIGELERRACRRWVGERFSQRRMVHDYLEVYERVLSGEAKARRLAV